MIFLQTAPYKTTYHPYRRQYRQGWFRDINPKGIQMISLKKRRNGLTQVFAAVLVVTAALGVSASTITISNIDDLRKIGVDEKTHPLNGSYVLGANINASGINFAPIGTFSKPFTGNFDGKGHTINNLHIDRPSAGHVGLFARVTGRVNNLGIVNANITGSFAVGAVAGTNDGTISNCYSSGTITGLRQETNVGGLTGVNGGAIEKSYSSATVNGRDNAGGLTGMLTITTTGRIEESYSAGSVNGSSAVGGLAGYALGGSIIKSFSMSTVTARNGSAGGLIGVEFRSANPKYNSVGQVGGKIVEPVQIVNSFWDINTSGIESSPGGGSGKTTREMSMQSTFQNAGWDFKEDDGWEIKEGKFYPQLKSAPDYTLIYKSGANGRISIQGVSGTHTSYEQTLNASLIGAEITAVPDAGFRFVNWSDSLTDPVRQDAANRNMEITAVFAAITIVLPVNGNGNGGGGDPPITGGDDPPIVTPKEFKLTYMAVGNGRLTVDGGSATYADYTATLEEGQISPQITAVPNAGFRFHEWSDGYSDPVRKDIAAKNITVLARFAQISADVPPTTGGDDPPITGGDDPPIVTPKEFKLTYTSVGSGRITVNDDGTTRTDYTATLEEGQISPQITAVPNTGFRFLEWSDGYSDPVRKDVAAKNFTVIARFAQIPTDTPPITGDDPPIITLPKYTLIYEAIGSGKIITNDDETTAQSIKTVTDVEQGSPGPKITAVPNPGFFFIRWSDDVTDAERKDIAARNINVFARFGMGTGVGDIDPTTQECAVAYVTDGNGTLKINMGETENTMSSYSAAMLCGEQTAFKVTAIPNAGYAFLKWSDGVISEARTGDRLLKDIATVTAEFVELHKLTYIAEAGGKVRLSADLAGSGKTTLEQWAAGGTMGQEVIAEPENSDYSFIGWSDGHGQPQRTDLANANKIVTARFLSAYTVTYRVITVDENGVNIDENVGGLIINDAGEPVYSHEMKILPGDAGLFVEAVVREGTVGLYKFLGWDDGYTLQRRIDVPTEVSQKVLTAIFREWDYIPIGTYVELREIGSDPSKPLDGKYELTNDIDAGMSRTIMPFTPIGISSSSAFTGEFLGNGFTIRNLYIYRIASDNVGLFGSTRGATIKSIRLESVEITGRDSVGTLVGRATNTTIDDCGLESLGLVNGRNGVGGLIGYLINVNNVTRCYSKGSEIYGTGRVGGLVGYNGGGRIERCYSTASVFGRSDIGGLVGEAEIVSGGGPVTIAESYATGIVNADGTSERIGGLIGRLRGHHHSGAIGTGVTVRRCYATGAVSGNSIVGGLVGHVHDFGTASLIELCYSAGKVTGNVNIGGFIGSFVSQGPLTAIATDSYYDSEISGMGRGVGDRDDINNRINSKSTQEMYLSSTFTNWSFEPGIGTWAISEGTGYPYLRALGPTKHPTAPPIPDLSKRLQTATITPRAIIHGKTLVITASPDANLQIRFYDLRGRTAARYTSSGSARISINRVPAGKYLLEVRENGKRVSVSPVVLR